MLKELMLVALSLVLLVIGYYFLDSLTPGRGEITGFSVGGDLQNEGNLITGRATADEEEAVTLEKTGEAGGSNLLTGGAVIGQDVSASAEVDVSVRIVE